MPARCWIASKRWPNGLGKRACKSLSPERTTQDTLLNESVDDIPESNLGVASPVLGSPQMAQHQSHREVLKVCGLFFRRERKVLDPVPKE